MSVRENKWVGILPMEEGRHTLCKSRVASMAALYSLHIAVDIYAYKVYLYLLYRDRWTYAPIEIESYVNLSTLWHINVRKM